mmetsp:Transcript_11840/g.29978  ORF Transcript_11840/g.29978 Transcript_11840/m.29978 type:complete len:207 (+) Transcript_11840:873-1493(+)
MFSSVSIWHSDIVAPMNSSRSIVPLPSMSSESMNRFTSSSKSWCDTPQSWRPARSSATVITPSLSASRRAKMEVRPCISAGLSISAIMRETMRCSLLILTKFWRRLMTSFEMGRSEAVPFSFIHGCCNTLSMEARSSGSSFSIISTHSLAPSEIEGQGWNLKFSVPSRYRITFCKISLSLDPKKGGDPHSKMYRITPADQMSASCP